ncbi:DUF5119 domain-containing protein [Paraprevotella clara]|uniref:DUF5119 domain-containing protein n=1 Tax=Paraprevotella clara TaxID=454154 RepID=UPI003FED891F
MKYLLPCMAAWLFAACEHKELCYDHSHTTHIDVKFDWQYAPDAETNKEVDGMCLWFYPIDEGGNRTGAPVYVSLSGMKGGKVEIPTGRYHVLYYNSDYKQVLFRGREWFLSHECYTRSASIAESVSGYSAYSGMPRAEGTENEPVVLTPEMMWGDNAMDVEITDNHIEYRFTRDGETEETVIANDEKLFKLMPHEQVCEYTYEIVNVENLEYVSQVCAAISGMSGSVFCAEEELDDECVTLPLEAKSNGVSTITGEFHTFGHHDLNDEKHILTVWVWYDNGETYWYTNDVTDQVDNAPDKRNVHIRIDGLKLPKPITNGDGFHPDVDDWEIVDVPVKM